MFSINSATAEEVQDWKDMYNTCREDMKKECSYWEQRYNERCAAYEEELKVYTSKSGSFMALKIELATMKLNKDLADVKLINSNKAKDKEIARLIKEQEMRFVYFFH